MGLRKYRIVRFDDGNYGVQLRWLIFWRRRFVDLNDPDGYTWPPQYGAYIKGSKDKAETAARERFPSWVPA